MPRSAPLSNFDHWGTTLDHWDYPTDGKGDCKIYALWKRKLLMDIGFPRQALLMTIVRDLEGQRRRAAHRQNRPRRFRAF